MLERMRQWCWAGLAMVAWGAPSGLAAQPILQRPHAEIYRPVLASRTSVHWSIASLGEAKALMRGESDVGPTGTIEIGPYGLVAVGGLSLEQARLAIETHLAAYIKQPQVTLQLASARPIIIQANFQPAEADEEKRGAETDVLQAAWQPLESESTNESSAMSPFPVEAEPLADSMPGTWHNEPALRHDAIASQWRTTQSMVHAPVMTRTTTWQQPQQPQQPGTENLNIYPQKMPNTQAAPMPQGVLSNCQGHPGAWPYPSVPRENAKVSLPPYVIEPPDILLVESTQQIADQAVQGQHLVRPDGTIGLGIYGSAYVAGMTLEQAKSVIGQQLARRIKKFDINNLNVDVLAYNSKFYYVITDGGGFGEQVVRFPITGNETVLDAIGQINGLPTVASRKHIWVARTNPHGTDKMLPVDWIGITQHGATASNYQLMPGDRVYVKAQRLITIDSTLAKILAPVERVFGITLLGSTTINSIRNRGNNFGQNP